MRKINFFITSLLATTLLVSCGDKTCKHVDENPKDHNCDLCGEKLSDHVDADNNFICDYCLQPISGIKSISFSKAEVEIQVVQTVDLSTLLSVTAVNGASKDVTWSTSNAGVAEVDSKGLVTPKAVGEVVITATSVFDSSKSATITIKVIAQNWDKDTLSLMKEYLKGATVPFFKGEFVWTNESYYDYGYISAISENSDDLSFAVEGLSNAGWTVTTSEGGVSTATIELSDLEIKLSASIYIDLDDTARVDVKAKNLVPAVWPGEQISEYFGDKTNVTIPACEADSYDFFTTEDGAYVLAHTINVEDTSESYAYWVVDLLDEDWVIDEADYYWSDGYYAIVCYKENIMLVVNFFLEKTGEMFIGIEVYLNEAEVNESVSKDWPEERINSICEGKTDVRLPIPTSETAYYGLIQNDPLSYSLFIYGVMYAEDYADILEQNGFEGGYDDSVHGYSYSKDNVVVNVLDGLYAIRVDVSITPIA